jgi:hypothetical protein
LAAGAADFPVKNPRILAKRDFLAAGLLSCVLDCGLRFPRPDRRLPPRREERRDPLGEYSDDMYFLLHCLGGGPNEDKFLAKMGLPTVGLQAMRTPLRERASSTRQGT